MKAKMTFSRIKSAAGILFAGLALLALTAAPALADDDMVTMEQIIPFSELDLAGWPADEEGPLAGLNLENIIPLEDLELPGWPPADNEADSDEGVPEDGDDEGAEDEPDEQSFPDMGGDEMGPEQADDEGDDEGDDPEQPADDGSDEADTPDEGNAEGDTPDEGDDEGADEADQGSEEEAGEADQEVQEEADETGAQGEASEETLAFTGGDDRPYMIAGLVVIVLAALVLLRRPRGSARS